MAPAVMCLKLLLIAVLLTATCQADFDPELDDILNEIFNTSMLNPRPATDAPVIETQSCGIGKECVPKELCSSGKVNRNDDGLCPYLQVCCSTDDQIGINEIDGTSPCGYRNSEGVGLVDTEVPENRAKFGEFPWMIGICVEKLSAGKINHVYHAGGSLITPKVVLTAAHKVVGLRAESLNARAGEWDSSNLNEPYEHQDRRVTEVTVHEQFNEDNLQNNIALLFLELPFKMAPNVQTVCLPPVDFSFEEARCYFTGWGKDRYELGSYQSVLKKMDLPIVPRDECQKKLRRVGIGIRSPFEFHSSHLCAGGESGKDACIGDGGSPLVCPIDSVSNRYFQAGIVAGGAGCGRRDVPGIYASLSQLRPWIDEQLGSKRIASTYYTP